MLEPQIYSRRYDYRKFWNRTSRSFYFAKPAYWGSMEAVHPTYAGTDKCQWCPAGTYSEATNVDNVNDCKLCEPGTFQPPLDLATQYHYWYC